MARDGEAKAHYVDSIGFSELPDFVQERRTLWEQQWMEVTEFTDSIELDGHEGTWHSANQRISSSSDCDTTAATGAASDGELAEVL